VKKLIVVGLLMLASCTPKPESKVTEALQKEFNVEEVATESTKNLDQLYGKDASKFKTSMKEFFADRSKIQISDVKTDGAKASGTVIITMPNRKDMEGLVSLTLFMDRKNLHDMTLDELINKIGKGSKVSMTSSRDIKDQTFAQTVELNRDAQDKWVVDPLSKKKFAESMTKQKAP
jgi:hypothetical protein